ncbi:MAG TPA: nucleoside triphosphate pyrophosphatase [Steroidobacteraceae bacterium]|jgi:septum formation protein|nr:nucleoside triphosphate pyrophosphatase [Steroidobacteraceae bacterium]
MPELILASTSPYRRSLLERLGLAFTALPPQTPEDPVPGELPPDRALRLAVAKAQAIASRRPDAVVIGSDQVAAVDNRVLDKPGDAARCRAQLTAASGSSARFHTACAVIAPQAGIRMVHIDTTTVFFRSLTGQEIERYVERERPFDCAGGFRAEGLGISLFESMESRDPTAIIGLPLIWLACALRRAGFVLP